MNGFSRGFLMFAMQRSRPITGLDRSGRKVFVAALNVFVRAFASGFVFSNGSHGSFRFRCEIDDNLLWLRLFEFDTLEI